MDESPTGLLSQVTFSILLALSLKPRHGYELMQQIKQDSLGQLKLGPGALYGTLKQLHEGNFIEEVPSELANDRRRYYRLTKKGWDRLEAELTYYQHVLELAHERQVLT